jgi:hypothetical protein
MPMPTLKLNPAAAGSYRAKRPCVCGARAGKSDSMTAVGQAILRRGRSIGKGVGNLPLVSRCHEQAGEV